MGPKLSLQPIDVKGADHRTIARIRLQASESGLDVIVESNQPGVLEAQGVRVRHILGVPKSELDAPLDEEKKRKQARGQAAAAR